MQNAAKPKPGKAFLRTVKRLDRGKLNSRWMALRNAIAIAAPLAVGIATGHTLGAVAVTTGALNVSFSDGRDPYAQRARRMLAWSVLGAVAVFTGSVTGKYHVLAIFIAAIWALIAGMTISIGARAGDLGLNTLVVLIIFAARGALSPEGAFIAACLVLGGGLLDVCLALFWWPVRRYEPERRVIGKTYLELAQELNPHNDVPGTTPLKAPGQDLQDVLSALGRDHSIDGERLRVLYDQTERLRLSAYALSRLRAESEHEARHGIAVKAISECVQDLLQLSAGLLREVGECLVNDAPPPNERAAILKLHSILQDIQARRAGESASALALEIASSADTLAGQVRLAVELAGRSLMPDTEKFLEQETAPPWNLQLTGWLATMRANLDIRSPIFRHAIRLAVCVGIADAIGRSINWERSYWIPMTVAVVLKPDFSSTFSRGVLRLLGTYAGLILATFLYHVVPQAVGAKVLLVGIFAFFLRWIGPANYGVLTIAISGLVVFLIAETGVPPAQAVLERFLNTTAGGVLALLVYTAWPTWERKAVPDAIADMLDASRNYFHAVTQRFTSTDPEVSSALDRTRREWRRVRSAAEASVDRVASEPGTTAATLDRLTSIMSSSHMLVHAIMGLEAGAVRRPPGKEMEAFKGFANDVEFTLYFLAAALRGSHAANQPLPKLREDHRRLLDAREAFSPAGEFLLLETDRLTVSLNTLREQVQNYIA